MIPRSIQNLIGSDRTIIAFLINFFLNLVINFFDDFLNLAIIFFKPFDQFFLFYRVWKKNRQNLLHRKKSQ